MNKSVLLDVLSKTAVIPPALVGKFKKIESDDYSPQFPLRLMSKDMDLIMETAGNRCGSACWTRSQVCSRRKFGMSGDLDLSAITPFVMDHASQS